MELLTILIADDHPVFRKGLRALLASMPTVELAGEATSGEEAIQLAEQLRRRRVGGDSPDHTDQPAHPHPGGDHVSR
jgi:CheY-like chemotaxis protein